MKNLSVCLIISIVLFSCNKSNTPPPPEPPVPADSLLKSFSVYEPLVHIKTLVVLGYDEKKLLASVAVHNYDSSGSTVQIDSTVLSFKQADSTTLPGSYDLTIYDPSGPPAGALEHHLVSYDNLNRFTRDSATMVQTNNYSTKHFTYDGYGNTTIESFSFDPQTPGSLTYQQVDTMMMSQDNMLSDIAYMTPGGQLIRVITRSFSTNLNPLYNQHLTFSFGTIFSYNSLVDFRSINLPDQSNYQDSDFQTVSLNFAWTKDTAGRVIKGIGSDPNTGITGQIYTYNY